MPLPSCTGPCDQGRKPCPTPDACRITDEEWRRDFAPAIGLLLVAASAVFTILAVVWLIHSG